MAKAEPSAAKELYFWNDICCCGYSGEILPFTSLHVYMHAGVPYTFASLTGSCPHAPALVFCQPESCTCTALPVSP